MTALPTVVETTPVSDDLATDMVVDRFLSRVAALTPAQWGTLDAIGQRESGGDPISRWRRARRSLGAFESPAVRDALAAVGAVIGWIAELSVTVELGIEHAFLPRSAGRVARREHWRKVGERMRAEQARARPAGDGVSPSVARAQWERHRLVEIAMAQPRGPGDAMVCLGLALTALRMRRVLAGRAFAEMYALVEPVIPAETIGATA